MGIDMDFEISEVLEVMAVVIAAGAFFIQWQAFSHLRDEVRLLVETVDRLRLKGVPSD